MVKKHLEWDPKGTLVEKAKYLNDLVDLTLTQINVDTYSKAGNIARLVSGLINEVKEDFSGHKLMAHENHKKICADESIILKPLTELVTTIKEKMLIWKQKVEAEEDERNDRILNLDPSAELPRSVVPAVEGITISVKYVPVVVNIDLVPEEYLLANLPALKEYARKTGGAGVIPGVQFMKTDAMSVSKSSNEELL